MSNNTPPVALVLPDEIIEAVRNHAGESVRQRRALAYSILPYLDEVERYDGSLATVYELVADEWNRATGDGITARTVRYWVQSVRVFTKQELRRYEPLTDAQLIEAVRIGNDCQTASPQEICDWCVSEAVYSVPAMRAHWLPLTGTDEQVDPPAVTGLVRYLFRRFPSNHPNRAKVEELIAALRELLAG